jgi:hypothetical protein
MSQESQIPGAIRRLSGLATGDLQTRVGYCV